MLVVGVVFCLRLKFVFSDAHLFHASLYASKWIASVSMITPSQSKRRPRVLAVVTVLGRKVRREGVKAEEEERRIETARTSGTEIILNLKSRVDGVGSGLKVVSDGLLWING